MNEFVSILWTVTVKILQWTSLNEFVISFVYTYKHFMLGEATKFVGCNTFLLSQCQWDLWIA